MGEQLNRIEFYQRSDYTKRLEGKNTGLLKFLSSLQHYDESRLEKMSLALEPLPGTTPLDFN